MSVAAATAPKRRAKVTRKAGALEFQLLVLVSLGLVAFGLVMVYSATSAPAALGGSDPTTSLKRQGIYALKVLRGGLGLRVPRPAQGAADAEVARPPGRARRRLLCARHRDRA